jgi:hypothetical protein
MPSRRSVPSGPCHCCKKPASHCARHRQQLRERLAKVPTTQTSVLQKGVNVNSFGSVLLGGIPHRKETVYPIQQDVYRDNRITLRIRPFDKI